MTVVPNPDLSGFIKEIDGIDEKYRRILEWTETRAEEHEVMSDWMAARHEAEKRMVELIDIRV
jgi:hypothetical protein